MSGNVSTTDLQNNFGRYLDDAQRHPIYITRHGRVRAVLMSEHHYQALVHGRAVSAVEDLDDEMLKAISRAEVPAEYAHLDKLLEETPERDAP